MPSTFEVTVAPDNQWSGFYMYLVTAPYHDCFILLTAKQIIIGIPKRYHLLDTRIVTHPLDFCQYFVSNL